jgi:hypothetical protein
LALGRIRTRPRQRRASARRAPQPDGEARRRAVAGCEREAVAAGPDARAAGQAGSYPEDVTTGARTQPDAADAHGTAEAQPGDPDLELPRAAQDERDPRAAAREARRPARQPQGAPPARHISGPSLAGSSRVAPWARRGSSGRD